MKGVFLIEYKKGEIMKNINWEEVAKDLQKQIEKILFEKEVNQLNEDDEIENEIIGEIVFRDSIEDNFNYNNCNTEERQKNLAHREELYQKWRIEMGFDSKFEELINSHIKG